MTQAREVQRYLQSGDYDMTFEAWPGSGVFARATNGDAALRKALIQEVKKRQAGMRLPEWRRSSGSAAYVERLSSMTPTVPPVPPLPGRRAP